VTVEGFLIEENVAPQEALEIKQIKKNTQQEQTHCDGLRTGNWSSPVKFT